MKYQKPIVHDMSKLSFAEGACASGLFVGTCVPNGFIAGDCSNAGNTAGVCSTSGNIVSNAVCATTGTAATNCNPHGSVAQIG